MKLLVLGATGHIGGEFVDLALARGHAVTAYARTPSKVTRRAPNLIVAQGDVLNMESLSAALQGQDAVISSLGLPAKQALRPSTFMAEAMGNVVATMKRADVQRLAVVSAAVLFPMRGLSYAFFRWLLRHHARDLSEMESLLRASTLDWTIARPPRLVSGTETTARAVVDGLPPGAGTISFRGVAAFLLDCVEREQHVRRVVGISE